jgi:hypothetical protein
MGDHGHPQARFQRAVSTGNPTLALAAAAELRHLALADQLALLLVLLSEPERYRRAAARWQANLCLELRTLTIADVQLIAAALQSLLGDGQADAVAALISLTARHHRADLVRVLERFSRGEFRRRNVA